MRCAVNARSTRRCRSTRERTHILRPIRLLPLALPRGTIPARRLISAATRTARMRTTATSSKPTRRCLHEALQPQCPPVTFQIKVNVTRQASKPTSCNAATKVQRLKSLRVKCPHQHTPPLCYNDTATAGTALHSTIAERRRISPATRRAQGQNALLKQKRVRTARWHRGNTLAQSAKFTYAEATLLLPAAV